MKTRVIRKAVSKDAGKTRQNKSTSWDLTNAYEVKALNFAEDEDIHGNYSEYVKRLVIRDMESKGHVKPDPMNRAPSGVAVEVSREITAEDFSSFI